MVIQLTIDGKYRGPGGRDPRKSRTERKQELLRLAKTEDGRDIILALWKEAKRIPPGMCPPGTMIQLEMVPDILGFE